MKTSFGELDVLRKVANEELIVYLKFESNGRPHAHSAYETFVVTKGSGHMRIQDKLIAVSAGDLITISPHSSHSMQPSEGDILEGFIWYHPQPFNQVS